MHTTAARDLPADRFQHIQEQPSELFELLRREDEKAKSLVRAMLEAGLAERL